MIENLNLYSISLLNLSLLIHPNWLLNAPRTMASDGTLIGFNDPFVLINAPNTK